MEMIRDNIGEPVAILGDRPEALAGWKNGECRILLAQIQSGTEGVDLTRARYAIFYSPDYSPGHHQQAMARVHRPGQTRHVTYIYLLALINGRRTIDSGIRDILAKRQHDDQKIYKM